MITRITTQKKNNQRYNIYIKIDQKQKYAFSVSEDVLVKYHLRKGLELSDETIENILTEDLLQRSYLMAINYLSYRMRSKKELIDYLKKKEINDEEIKKIIERLCAENLLNDRAFADAFVRTRMNQSTKGPLLIKRELIDKGITNNIAQEAIKQIPYETQFETALKWAKLRMQRKRKQSYQKQKQQLKASLVQKGYTDDIILDVMSSLNTEVNETDEWQALVYHGDKLYRRYSRKHSGTELIMKLKAALYRQGFSSELITQYIDRLGQET